MTVATHGLTRHRDLSTLTSALITETSTDSKARTLQWLDSFRRQHPLCVERIPFGDLHGWHFRSDPLRLCHTSGKFFTIEGIRIQTDHGPVPSWDQPIINQPEIGIIGILTRVTRGVRYWLMQAKVEPGNINGPQLSPTLQATRSNYTRAHRGQTPKYLEYFRGEKPAQVIVDHLHSEQASRFLRKRNRNLIVEVEDEVEIEDGFRWLTLGEIKELLRLDHVVNMDARSVLSCVAFPTRDVLTLSPNLTEFGSGLLDSASISVQPVMALSEIMNWLSRMRSTYSFSIQSRGLDSIEDWLLTDQTLAHKDGRYFSVIGVRTEISGREVSSWSQPLLYHSGEGLNGMIVQKFGGVLHFLIRACLYPGNRDTFDLGSTVSRSDYKDQIGQPTAPPFLEFFVKPEPETVRFSSQQSEEGGRFFQYRNHYMIVELPPDTLREVPDEFVWMTLQQIQELMPHGYFNIEARNIFACLQLT